VTAPSPSVEIPLVLIVDDNERNRRLSGEVLRAAGFRTIEAATGAAGIALAADRMPDVILLDIELPDMNGADVARELRREARTARIPVVAHSARPYVGEDDRLLEAGFVGYLEKPIDVREFPEQVRSFCRSAGD
jgi:two-component system, cell cycle response regulator DivK